MARHVGPSLAATQVLTKQFHPSELVTRLVSKQLKDAATNRNRKKDLIQEAISHVTCVIFFVGFKFQGFLAESSIPQR